MNVYAWLSRLSFLNKYSYKFLFVAFLGIHVPLIGIILTMLVSASDRYSTTFVIVAVLIYTLLATGITLFFLNRLLEPLVLTKSALEHYTKERRLPDLPTKFNDEVGILMRDVQHTVTDLDDLLTSKRDLISLLGHDLRTPAAQTVMAANAISESTTDPQIGEYADWIKESGNRQLTLLTEVLQLLKQEQMHIQHQDKQVVQLNGLADASLATLQDALARKSLTVQRYVPPAITVHVHPVLFGQVLQNLLHNACKFSHEGGTIELRATSSDKRITLSVADQGVGFDPALAPRLFDRFTSFGRKGTSGESSTGVGLYLCRRIVEQHNGRLYAHSDGDGRGATFTISLPK